MNNLTIDQLRNLADLSLTIDDPVPFEYRRADAQYYPFLYLVAQKLQPKLVVELGVLDGRSTAHFAHGAPNARIVGIDLDIPTASFPYPHLEFWQGDTLDMVQRIADIKIPISLLFVDATHTAENALGEYLLYSPLMENGGIILFDDIFMEGMMSLWPQIPEPKFASDKLHGSCGFGIAIWNTIS